MNRLHRFVCTALAAVSLVGCAARQNPLEDRRGVKMTAAPPTSLDLDRFVLQTWVDGNLGTPNLVFGSWGEPSVYDNDDEDGPTYASPAILVGDDDGWRVIHFGLEGDAWMGVFVGPGPEQVWAVTDHVVEDPGHQLDLWHSGDGGRTWEFRSSILKPIYFSRFESLRLGPDGRGTLTIYLDQDYSEKITRGHYVYRTKDWGKSWSKPKLEPEALYRAATVPESHQRDIRTFIREYFPKADQNLPPSPPEKFED